MGWKSWFSQNNSEGFTGPRVIKQGPASRVIFFYPGEEGTYVDRPIVTLFENGIVHLKAMNEETTTHLQNCEILWAFSEQQAEDRSAKVRLLKPQREREKDDTRGPEPEA